MELPSVSCLFYLFGDEVDYGEQLHRGDAAVAVPHTGVMVPLFALERVLMEVAIWDLIHRGLVRDEYDPGIRPPWRDRRWSGKLISFKQPRLLLTPMSKQVLPPPNSLTEQLYSVIPLEGSSVTVAVIDWAGDRWPLPYEAVVSVPRQEAVRHGILSGDTVFDGRSSRRSGHVVGSPPADHDRLTAVRSAFSDAQSAWDEYCDERSTESLRIIDDVRSSLGSLRPTITNTGGGP